MAELIAGFSRRADRFIDHQCNLKTARMNYAESVNEDLATHENVWEKSKSGSRRKPNSFSESR